MPTVPDGDRELTIWTWLHAVGRPTAIVLGLGVAVAGCQAIPGDGPWMNGAKSTSSEALPFDVIDLTPTTVIAYRPGSDQPATVERPSARPEPGVSAGDVLRVRTTVESIRAVAGNDLLTTKGEILTADDELVVTALSTIVARGTARSAPAEGGTP